MPLMIDEAAQVLRVSVWADFMIMPVNDKAAHNQPDYRGAL
jgi:hypothetical protein